MDTPTPTPSRLARIVAPIRSFLRLLRRNLKKTIAIVIFLLIAWAVYGATRPKQPVYVTAVAERGDLRQVVEAVGTITSEKALDLQFPTLDVVSQVYVKEGDQVRAGQRLAQLRSGMLSASIASASANVQSAQASLRALEEGSRPEDIAITEAQVANKRASLEAAKQTVVNSESNLKTSEMQLEILRNEAKISLAGNVSTAGSTISQHVATSKTALLSIRGVYNANDVQDAVVKGIPSGYDTMQANITSALNDIASLQAAASPADYQAALTALAKARVTIAFSTDIANRAYDIMTNLPLSTYFTNTSKETNKATIATQKSYVQSALAAIDTTFTTLRDASATYDTRISAQQGEINSLRGTRDRAKADIGTYETSLRIDEASLTLKKAPARQTDIDSARARVRQAQADVARAAAQYGDTVLTAPVDGIITKVNVKAGQMRPSEPSVTMLGNTPFRVEMFVSEVDIPKIRVAQTGSIRLDAFRDIDFALRVGQIDSAATDKDGVPKYRVKLDFVHRHDEFKVGMTGDAEVVTGFVGDVVSVPSRAVIQQDGKDMVRVQAANGDIAVRAVTTGMEGEGGNVEVTGIEQGEVVIVLEKK